MAKVKVLDFTNVTEGGRFNTAHVTPGDYAAVIEKVEDAPSKQDGKDQWLFTIRLKSRPSARYPYYCKLEEGLLWKVRNLFEATGVPIPKKRVKIDPDKLVGKDLGVTLEDDEYEGKMRSKVVGVLSLSELGEESEDNDDEDEDEDEEEEEKPRRRQRQSKTKKEEDEDEDEDELEELDIEDV